MTINQVADILGEAGGATTITSSEDSTRMTDTMTDATATALETAGATATTTTEAGSSSSPGEGPAGATQEDEVQLTCSRHLRDFMFILRSKQHTQGAIIIACANILLPQAQYR